MSTAFQLYLFAHVTLCNFSTERHVFAGGKAVITSYMRLSASRLPLLSTFLWRNFYFVLSFLFLPILYCCRRNKQLKTWRLLTKVVLSLLLNFPWVSFLMLANFQSASRIACHGRNAIVGEIAVFRKYEIGDGT